MNDNILLCRSDGSFFGVHCKLLAEVGRENILFTALPILENVFFVFLMFATFFTVCSVFFDENCTFLEKDLTVDHAG